MDTFWSQITACRPLAFVLLMLLSVGCVQEVERGPEPPPVLRIGVLPGENPETLRSRYEPLVEYLAEQLQIPCTLTIPDSYGDLVTLFHNREVDLAHFGGYTFIQAAEQDQAIPLVMRSIDTRFTSFFIVGGASTAQTMADLEGQVLSFGAALSTSGHMMPRYFLQQEGIVPESFFSAIRYSGAHDQTAYLVRDGLAQVGAAKATTIRSMFRENLLTEDDIRVLWETPPYADYVWAIHAELGEELAFRVRMAFLSLTPENARHGEILARVDATGFIPADLDDFARLESIFQQEGALSPAEPIR